ncbi:MAG TPA: ROK family protein [Chloroflexia bacterium]|nr:ROK family protein [Chloroflexia bacterium]
MHNRHESGGLIYAGIEAGGTKFVCGVGTGPGDLRAVTDFPTTTSQETLARTIAFLREQHSIAPIAAVGIGTFGPVDLSPTSPTYGYITSTPKPGWANTDFAGTVQRAINVPVAFDTDVNAAALGEHRWGATQGLDTFVYLTIGTGIGGGGIVKSELLHGMLHPEMGHILIPHDREADPFPGACPYHGDCLEGLASGPALERRWGQRGETLPPDHPAWPLEAHYLALALVNLICVLSPQRIVMGGGMMQQPQLFPMVRKEVQRLLNGYMQAPQLLAEIDSYIVPPALGNRAGVLGAIALAQRLVT